MGLGSSRELQAKDNVLRLTDDRMHNKRSKRAAMSSDTDGKQLAPENKRRRQEEEFEIKKEEHEDGLPKNGDELEDSKKPQEEDETEVKEEIGDDLQLDRDGQEDRKKPPRDVKEEEEEVESKEDGKKDRHQDKDEPEDCKTYQAAVKIEEVDKTEVKEDSEDEFQRDKDVRVDSKKSPAAVKEDEEEKEDLEETIESGDDDSDNVTISPVTLVPSDSSSDGVGLLRVGCLAATCAKRGPQLDKAGWNLQYKKLHDYYVKHGHCELFWAINRLIFILNTPTNTPLISVPELQLMCQSSSRKTRHWADGSTLSVNASKLAKWIRNEKRGSTRLLSSSI
jgi:hypothetical protein